MFIITPRIKLLFGGGGKQLGRPNQKPGMFTRVLSPLSSLTSLLCPPPTLPSLNTLLSFSASVFCSALQLQLLSWQMPLRGHVAANVYSASYLPSFGGSWPLKILNAGTSLVGYWLRIRMPVQGASVRALVWEDPTCHGATKPVHHNY